MRALGNFLWFILGGAIMGLAWFLFGILAYLTIVGIPWGKSCFTIARFSFFPFGKTAVSRRELSNGDDVGTGPWGFIGNILWFVFAGVWLAIGHLGAAVVCFISIIGIPFGIQHLKLAGISIFPIGKTIVPNEVARAALEQNAGSTVSQSRYGP